MAAVRGEIGRGERITFRKTGADTAGELLEIDVALSPDGHVPGMREVRGPGSPGFVQRAALAPLAWIGRRRGLARRYASQRPALA